MPSKPTVFFTAYFKVDGLINTDIPQKTQIMDVLKDGYDYRPRLNIFTSVTILAAYNGEVRLILSRDNNNTEYEIYDHMKIIHDILYGLYSDVVLINLERNE